MSRTMRSVVFSPWAWVAVISAGLPAAAQDTQTEWNVLAGLDSLTTPAISGHVDRQLHVAAISSSGIIATRSSATPSVWTPWDILGPDPCAPSPCPKTAFYANPRTPPVFASFATTLYLFARGADDNLYEIRKVGSGAWAAAWIRLTSDGSVKGPISVAFTSPVNSISHELHVLHTSRDESVQYRRFNEVRTQVGDNERWCDASSGQLGTDGVSQVVAAIRRSNSITVEEKHHPWILPFAYDTESALPGTISDMSAVVYYQDAYHLTYAAHYLCGDTNFCDSIIHIRVRPGQVDDNYLRYVVDLAADAANAGASLALYRNKLVAAYTDNGRVSYARWDNADAWGPWVGQVELDPSSTTNHPVALHAFNRLPLGSNNDYADPNFGNDLFAAILNSAGNVEYMNFSRSAFVSYFDPQIQLYNYGLDSGCPNQTDPNAPTPVADAFHDGRPFLSELGYMLWVLPDWLASHVYKDGAELGCLTGNATGRFDPPCANARYPVIIKRGGGIYICSGVWVNQGGDYKHIWEELGHSMSGAMGFNDNGVAPTQANADLTGIPLNVLSTGYGLFSSQVNGARTCTLGTAAGNRCRGFTGHAGNYDVGTRQHSLIYLLYYYMGDADRLRAWIADDLNAGQTLLQQKYDWVKVSLFQGVEFGQNLAPLEIWNDQCADAKTITDGEFVGSTKLADSDGSSTYTIANDSPSVWYKYEAPCSGELAIDLCGSSFDTVISVHSGCPGEASNELDWNDDCFVGTPCSGSTSCLTMSATQGTTYWLRVSSFNGVSGDFRLNVASACVQAPPGHDTCCNASQLVSGVQTSTVVAANNDSSATCGQSDESPDVWHSFTAPVTGRLRVNTCGTHDSGGEDGGMDTVLALFSDCIADEQSELTCNDDFIDSADATACNGLDQGILRDSAVVALPAAGETVLVRVSPYGSSAPGTYFLNMEFDALDHCDEAVEVGEGLTPFRNVGATTDGPLEPDVCDYFGSSDVPSDIWYCYTPSCDGVATADLCDSDFDTRIAVYEGCGCPAAGAIACNDDNAEVCGAPGTQSALSFSVNAGNSYLLRIGGHNGAQGTGRLNVGCFNDCNDNGVDDQVDLTAGSSTTYSPVDFSALHNGNLQTGTNLGFPSGEILLGGVPFVIPTTGNNYWHSVIAVGPNPRSIDIPVNRFGVMEVHTLINTYWGQGGPASYASLEFFGSDGAYFRKDLIGNEDIRDFRNFFWTNSINGSTTVNVVWVNPDRLDKQRIVLPADFHNETLLTIRLSDSGGDVFQRTFLAGVTVLIDSSSSDCNGNSKPDECDARADFNGDGVVNLPDLPTWLDCLTAPCSAPPCQPALYASSCCSWIDFDDDGDVDLPDVAELQRRFGTTAGSGCTVPPPGLVGWWTGDDTSEDIVGGNHAVLVNGATFAPGNVGSAFQFVPGGSYAATNANLSLTGNTPRTFCAWVKSASDYSSSCCATPFSHGAPFAGGGFGTFISFGKWWFWGYQNDFNTGVNTDTSWHHHCIAYDGVAVAYYLDGTPIASQAKALNTGSSPLVLGDGFDHRPDTRFEGLVDEVMIWDRALTPEEVRALEQAGSEGACNP